MEDKCYKTNCLIDPNDYEELKDYVIKADNKEYNLVYTDDERNTYVNRFCDVEKSFNIIPNHDADLSFMLNYISKKKGHINEYSLWKGNKMDDEEKTFYDIAEVFELYAYYYLKDNLNLNGLDIYWEGAEENKSIPLYIKSLGEDSKFYISSSSEKKVLQPDFVIKDCNDSYFIILDAKFKNGRTKKSTRDDRLQLLAYSYGYQSGLIGHVFPLTGEIKKEVDCEKNGYCKMGKNGEIIYYYRKTKIKRAKGVKNKFVFYPLQNPIEDEKIKELTYYELYIPVKEDYKLSL